ncbi:cell cycle regulator of non-homologous end joining [Cebidichthys violaceus]|uniref:cell cycle regulator of non-homologous end joining n=1 Tax=Cebidichthys violaceus TaxID=271503 RepID=UPI0035CA3C76
MSERHRALPSWMAKKEEKVKEKEPLKSRRKRKTARAAFYCMNEKELVEAAVTYLTNGACEDVALPADLKVRENPASSKKIAKLVTVEEESSDCGDVLETTYVSETDMDITEVETVPYTNRSGPEQDRGGLVKVGLEAEEKEEHSQVPAEEDDALRLVREIFFT